MRISVRAKPRARKAEVTYLGERPLTGGGTQPCYAVAVSEPALEGRANAAIERALAEHFGVPRTRVKVVLGSGGRDKVVEIG